MALRTRREQANDLVLAFEHDDDHRREPIKTRVRSPRQQAQEIGDQSLVGNEGRGIALQRVVRGAQRGLHLPSRERHQIVSGSILIAPQGHSVTQTPHPLQ